ncbi:MAG: FAD-dependent oxidoreductase [Gammaproteobacteria bacterium]|nr:FAD-dependent oxidoreductase [Gammaproteobacteria bacterium]
MTDLVVIGGGIVGVSTCYYAKFAGARCTLIERDGIASQASGYAFGGLHPRLISKAGSEMPRFAARSFEEHQRLHGELESLRSVQSTWRRRSSISLAWDEMEASEFRTHANESSTSSRWLDATDIHRLEPRIAHDALGGLLTTDSAEVDSAKLADSLFQLAEPEFLEDEVVGVKCTNNGVAGIRTRSGELITGDAFVFAMGPWSNLAFDWFDLNRFIQPLKGQILRLQVDGPALQHSFSTNGNYMSTKQDGLLWIGTTEEQVEFDESPTNEGRRAIVNVLRRMLPGPIDYSVIKQTACLRPITPDGELILGRVPRTRNAYIGTGGGRKGILYGPLMGKYLAELALEAKGEARWSSLSLNRIARSH